MTCVLKGDKQDDNSYSASVWVDGVEQDDPDLILMRGTEAHLRKLYHRVEEKLGVKPIIALNLREAFPTSFLEDHSLSSE